MDEELTKALVFAILMENGNGILDKSPSYIMEKWEMVKDGMCEGLLDFINAGKLREWKEKWL